jgi:non-homologous end joining protein Ku
MVGKDMAVMGRVVLSNRRPAIIIQPMDLRGITLRYAHEIRSEAEFFAEIPEMILPKEMLSAAKHIVRLASANILVCGLLP